MLKNIEQIRAKNALGKTASEVKKQGEEGDALSGFPSLIINNGLLATLAFSAHKGESRERIAAAIAEHLVDRNIVPKGTEGSRSLIKALSECDSSVLRRATTETLAYLAYLKRFQR